MDRITKDHFARTCDGVPPQKRGHIPTCRTEGLKIVCSCSCGVKQYAARFGNTAGWSYAVSYAVNWYLRHTNQVEVIEVFNGTQS
jgi:hypothetical protein